MGIEWRSGSLDGIKRNRWDGMGEVGDLIGYIYGISCSLLALDKRVGVASVLGSRE